MGDPTKATKVLMEVKHETAAYDEMARDLHICSLLDTCHARLAAIRLRVARSEPVVAANELYKLGEFLDDIQALLDQGAVVDGEG